MCRIPAIIPSLIFSPARREPKYNFMLKILEFFLKIINFELHMLKNK